MPINIFSAFGHSAQRTVSSPAWRLCIAVMIAGLFLQPAGRAHATEVFDPPTISNPNLFTSHLSLPDVDQSTGAFTHRVPLDIPPGRNGLTPDLALQYNSQQLDDGIVGYGWSLSLPYIERFNRTGIERLYTVNYFSGLLEGSVGGFEGLRHRKAA